jgi:hypothetical protein
VAPVSQAGGHVSDSQFGKVSRGGTRSLLLSSLLFIFTPFVHLPLESENYNQKTRVPSRDKSRQAISAAIGLNFSFAALVKSMPVYTLIRLSPSRRCRTLIVGSAASKSRPNVWTVPGCFCP